MNDPQRRMDVDKPGLTWTDRQLKTLVPRYQNECIRTSEKDCVITTRLGRLVSQVSNSDPSIYNYPITNSTELLMSSTTWIVFTWVKS